MTKDSVSDLYERHALEYDRYRSRSLQDRAWLDRFLVPAQFSSYWARRLTGCARRPALREETGAVAEVQDQQETALRSEASQRPALQGGQEVVAKDRRFVGGVHADLGQPPPVEGDAIPAPKT